ncbi:MAG: 2-C-methyl-D-erythritol 4-phosphate cytidylyltransferase, partial [Bacteroidales bacterium]|nr:2-C-methyl-D-erythritol 4-phosphate cytidylyltransferase [Bacteroidales bacterium]
EYESRFTDDASLVEAIGGKIVLVEGKKENIKLTQPFDFLIAEKLIDGKGN